MDNQNDNPTIDDLDLSGIEGFSEGTLVDETPIAEPEVDAPVEAPEPAGDDGPISWSSVEKLVPEPLHEDLKPLVDEWRRQYERVLDETSPYRQYSERGVSQRDIDLALNIQQALLENPKRFYDGMGETYGWNQIQQQQAMQEQYNQYAQPPAPQNTGFDLFAEEPQAPQIDQRLMQTIEQQQARLDQLEQMQMSAYQQAQQEQQQALGRQQLEAELGQIEAKYGQFDKGEVVKRAIANASAGADPSVIKAFHELKDYEDKLRRNFVASRPPKVMGSGNANTPPVPADLSSDEAKRDAALQLAIRLGATAPGSYAQ
jgi:hypothetical protein